ncbi:unnamed protein product [Arctia plantaginis]|uniref:PAP-associated domain-containing protein n=1 Tax=Arctia plantaginis TaxID=874455 RepID=A0A8S1B8M6_ARCPL|nr:unnamed protein product [Arctia plantaginis]
MNTTSDIMDSSRLCYEGDFNTQVKNVLSHVRMTATEVRNLRNLFVDLELALQDLAPGLQVHPFGSIVTGLGIRTSDVDCFIELPHGMKPNDRHVMRARNILRRHYLKFGNPFAIINATVPIVKFLHVPTNCFCDINFTSPAGVYNSELISYLLQMDTSDRALQLAVLVKYWSKVNKFTGTNLLASYALTLMVIFYLQLMNMLPSIYDLQKVVPPGSCMVNNWNTGFDRSVSYNRINDSLYDLLGGFFKCYASMNFDETIISPYMGRLLSRKTFKNFNEIPPEFALYKYNISHNLCKKPLNVDGPLCVQDPFEHARNCAGAVHPRLGEKIKSHFRFAAMKFDELPPQRFLQAIFTEDQTQIVPRLKKRSKHVFVNKVTKQKNNAPQKTAPQKNALRRIVSQKNHGVTSNLNLIGCYEMIRNSKK